MNKPILDTKKTKAVNNVAMDFKYSIGVILINIFLATPFKEYWTKSGLPTIILCDKIIILLVQKGGINIE